jgi:hypothetical protein
MKQNRKKVQEETNKAMMRHAVINHSLRHFRGDRKFDLRRRITVKMIEGQGEVLRQQFLLRKGK